MKLYNAARYFDTTRCMDSYSGDYLYNGQLDVYSEGVRDGVTVQRRVLELAPDLIIPAHRCLTFGGETWIVGTNNPDIWKGNIIREKYALHKSDALADVRSLAQVLADDPPTQEYAGLVWTKTIKQIETNSEEFNVMNIYFSTSAQVRPHDIVHAKGSYYLVKEVYGATAGHLAAISEMIDEPFSDTMKITTVTRDPVTQAPITSTQEYKAIRLRWQSDFAYHSRMTPNFERGDMQAVIPMASVIVAGSRVTLSDGDWNVKNTAIERGVKYVHLNRGH